MFGWTTQTKERFLVMKEEMLYGFCRWRVQPAHRCQSDHPGSHGRGDQEGLQSFLEDVNRVTLGRMEGEIKDIRAQLPWKPQHPEGWDGSGWGCNSFPIHLPIAAFLISATIKVKPIVKQCGSTSQSLFLSSLRNKVRSLVCWLGKSCLISSMYPEQFDLRLLRIDRFKTRKIQSQQTSGKSMAVD